MGVWPLTTDIAALFSPVTTRRTFEEAVTQIAEVVRAGELRVGDRLPSERILSARMKISRPTLREAVKVLVDANVIDVKPGAAGGMFVTSDIIPARLLKQRSEIRVSEVSEVLEARRLLEPRVAQLAALYATEADFEIMRRSIEDQRAAAHDRERFLQLDLRFHLAIARSTQNSIVVALIRVLLGKLEIARDMTIRAPHDSEWAIAIHERTLSALITRDYEAIDTAMDEHMGYLERMWEEEHGRAKLRSIPSFLRGDAGRGATLG